MHARVRAKKSGSEGAKKMSSTFWVESRKEMDCGNKVHILGKEQLRWTESNVCIVQFWKGIRGYWRGLIVA